MNAYLSREEKEHFIRATALVAVLEATIDGYASAKSTHTGFLKNLRMGRTMISKALTMRADALEPEAKAEAYKQFSRLEFICVPKPEAKKAHTELMALKTTLPMEVQDFQDWYEVVVETTCKTCTRPDYETCPARRVMTKYGVYPYNPEAKGSCQYSYVDELPAAAVIPAEQYEIPEAKEEKEEELAVEQEEQPNEEDHKTEVVYPTAEESLAAVSGKQEGLLPVIIGLVSGNKLQLDLPDYMATNLLNELNYPGRNKRAICGCHVGEELVVVDMVDVVTMQVTGLKESKWSRVQPALPVERPTYTEQHDDGEKERYRVECKCGAEYYCSMNIGRDKARCRDCKSIVFADRQAEPLTDSATGDTIILLTNRYWVERTERPEPARFSGNSKQGYSDPCNPFA